MWCSQVSNLIGTPKLYESRHLIKNKKKKKTFTRAETLEGTVFNLFIIPHVLVVYHECSTTIRDTDTSVTTQNNLTAPVWGLLII